MKNSRKYEQGEISEKYRRRNEPEDELAQAGGYALQCEHPGCAETKAVADYIRSANDVESDEEGPLTDDERADWLREPISLCPAHAGQRKRA